MTGATAWIPKGPGGVNNIAIPLVLFPAFWAAMFFYALLEDRMGRGWAIMSVVALINLTILFGGNFA